MRLVKIVLLFAAICGFSACENNFDPKIYGVLGTENFPSTEKDYESLLMNCYIPFANVSWGYSFTSTQLGFYTPTGGVVRLLDGTSDLCAPWVIGTWGGAWLSLTSGQFEDMALYGANAADTSPGSFEKVRDVTRYTHIIGLLENATTIPETVRDEFLGEARFLRGMMMYYLLHYYGPVPVILDPNLVGNIEAEANLVRPSLEWMVQSITDDLEYGVAHMSETQTEKGRYTADYARFCLMRHYLNEGKEHPDYYQKACELFTQFTGTYSLFKQGANPYLEQFKSANAFNCETIMAVICSTDDANGNMNGLSFYITPPDVAPYDDKGNPTPYELHQGPWGHCLNIDPTFYSTFESGDLRAKGILTSYYSKDGHWVTAEDLGVKWNGFICSKFPVESKTFSQPAPIPLARWAEVLLMYAEALTRRDNNVSQEALNAINEVRERAGLAGTTRTSSVDEFLDAILDERGHELYFEGGRKVDLIRFNKYYTKMKDAGRAPTSQYFPIPDYAIRQAERNGKILEQYFTRDDYDGPKR